MAVSLTPRETDHDYLDFDDRWFVSQCDVVLMVEGVSLHAHRLYLTKASKVLKSCINSTAENQGIVSPAHPIVIHLADKLQAVKELLRLVYTTVSDISLLELLGRGKDLILDVARLAHKYDMPLLLAQMDEYLSDIDTQHSVYWHHPWIRCSLLLQ